MIVLVEQVLVTLLAVEKLARTRLVYRRQKRVCFEGAAMQQRSRFERFKSTGRLT
jgi:hypothetical protein